MADYTLHFGFRWNGPLAGSSWGIQSSYRILQYALASNSSKPSQPSWFNVPQNSTFSVMIWDLSSTAVSRPSFGLDMSVSTPDGEPYTKDDSPLTISEQMTWYAGPPPYFSFAAANFASDSGGTCPWGSGTEYSNTVDSVTASGPLDTDFKLSFRLTVTTAGQSQIFVSDPEPRIISG